MHQLDFVYNNFRVIIGAEQLRCFSNPLIEIMKTEICLRILTPKNLNDHKEAIALLGFEVELMPEIVPEKFGSWESLKNEFVVEKISEIVAECWAHEGFLWSRKKPFAVGSIQFQVGKACVHSGVKVDCALGAVPQCNLVEFLQRSSKYLNADLSILHLLNPEDMERGAKTRTVVPAANGECYFGITTHDLNKYIPDVYWAMILALHMSGFLVWGNYYLHHSMWLSKLDLKWSTCS